MVVIAREPRANAAFLRLPRSGNHHDLGLFGVGPTAAPSGAARSASTTWPGRSTPSTSSTQARDALLSTGAYTGESSHGATKSVYGADPDGNEFEIMWMLPREEWGAYENAAPIDHLDLAGRAAPLERGRHRGPAAARLDRHPRTREHRAGAAMTADVFGPVVVAGSGADDPAARPGRSGPAAVS